MIRKVQNKDFSAITSIYNHYIRETTITFDIDELSEQIMADRIEKVTKKYPYLVIEEEDRVVGYAYASVWKDKDAYDKTVESTVYLDPSASGKGYGSKIYKALLQELKQQGFRIAIACITIPNPVSIALHEKLGFRKNAIFEKLGEKFGELHDVGYWQLML